MATSHDSAVRRGPTMVVRALLACALAVATLLTAGQHQAHAATGTAGFKGVNWADQRDNFVNGVLYPSGLSSTDTYSSAYTVGQQVVGQLDSLTGANTVRMPINEPTVANDWSVYTGAIDGALTKGNVILSYWAWENGEPDSVSAFDTMWDTVTAKYGSNANVYFEVINEPYAYSTSALQTFYSNWLSRYSSVPKGHVILDGSGYATGVSTVGGDSALNGTLIGAHYYTFFVSSPYNDETDWANGISSEIGSYASRTIATEWGAPMSTGSKNSVEYDPIDYSIESGSYFAEYVRGVSSELRTLGVGSVYWPGLRDGDWYSLTSKTGSGSSIALSLVNSSGLTRLQYAWGVGTGGGTYVSFRNDATSLYFDGAGSTTSGSDTEQYASSGSTNQEWSIVNDGTYVLIENRATGMYLDGMGRTTNGAAVGQYSYSNSTNQQWTLVSDGNYVMIKNRGTGLYIDGMGRTTNGASLAQYASSGSTNQQWKISAAG
ncbi:RICIN domain-containing protein [Actinospica robiniae]|uniref:RICIN domain-containing protein n=1 Tax=Actinospica robiniae TaxID=304901 RepID=UPI000555025E|nr:RICIN domain-containing protein [Actinospica robiniae]